MPYYASDFADWLDQELTASRDRLQRTVSRTEALVALRSRAFDLSAQLQRPITPDDLFGSARSEQERAELQLLADRLLEDGTRDTTGLGDLQGDGHRSDPGAGF